MVQFFGGWLYLESSIPMASIHRRRQFMCLIRELNDAIFSRRQPNISITFFFTHFLTVVSLCLVEHF